MPKLDEEAIKRLIADGSLTAVTLDTSIFDRYGCNLDFPLLKSLIQFKAGNISVVFSDIIISEVTSHITEKATDTQSALSKAIKKFSETWKTSPEAAEITHALKHDGDPVVFSSERVANYINEIEGDIISPVDNTDITKEVIRRYFSGEIPFENRKEKKSEFPDAFALVSLDHIFSQRQKYLLCVSLDQGWHLFAEQSNWLICSEYLDVALSYFHDSGRNIADNVVEALKKGTAEILIADIGASIQFQLDNFDFNPETHSGLDYEAEPEAASLLSVDFDSLSNPIVIDANDEEVSFTVKVNVLIYFEASFTFHAYDSIDKDYVHLSTEYANVQSTHTFRLVVTVSRKLDPQPVPVAIAVVKDRLDVNFGFVEPFPNEDPTHEKY